MPIKGVWEETVWPHILFENIKDRKFCLQCYLLSLNNRKKRTFCLLALFRCKQGKGIRQFFASFHNNCYAITKKCVTVSDFFTLFISKLIKGWIPFFLLCTFLSADKRSKKTILQTPKETFSLCFALLSANKGREYDSFLGIKNIFCIDTFCANKGKPFLIILN